MTLSDVIEKRFWSRVEVKREEDCWEWRGNLHRGGLNTYYGRMRVGAKSEYAHRISYTIAKGSIPFHLVVRHMCNNSLCCNPNHLRLGTHSDNVRDKVIAGRQAKGQTNGKTRLTERQVIVMRYKRKGHGYFAKMFGVDVKTIANARLGETWKHLNKDHPPQPERYTYSGGHFGH